MFVLRLGLGKTLRMCRLAAATTLLWGATPAVLFAQGGNDTDKAYVNQYFIVLALIGLGTFMVCRPSSRADEPDKRDLY